MFSRNAVSPRGIFLWAAAAGWAGLIWGLSSVPGGRFPSMPGGDFPWSVAAHFFLYFMLSGLIYSALGETKPAMARRKMFLSVFFTALAYGVIDEFHQSLVPGRHPAAFDVAVDAAGAACFLGYARLREKLAGGILPRG